METSLSGLSTGWRPPITSCATRRPVIIAMSDAARMHPISGKGPVMDGAQCGDGNDLTGPWIRPDADQRQ